MVALPAWRGVSATLVTVVRRKLGDPPENWMLICSDCERLTTSKSLKSGSCSSTASPLDETATTMRRLRVPSSAISSASVDADSSTSSAAPAARDAAKATAARLPILLCIAAPLPAPLREPPQLQVLLARLQRIQ